MADIPSTHYDYLIIGAGLTGLSLGAFLREQGATVAIVEASHRAGGKLHTVVDGDYTFESGPNTGVVGNDAVLALFDLLKERTSLIEANKQAAVRYILKDGRPMALPTRFWSAMRTPLFPWRDKLNILLEPFRRRSKDKHESIGALVRRRLGKSFFDYAVDPFVSGIYAGDPDSLVARYALPKLYRLEAQYGSFIRGAWKRRHVLKAEKLRGVSKAIFSVEGGFSRLAEALVDYIGAEHFYFEAKGARLMQSGGRWKAMFEQGGQARCLSATTAVTTVPAFALPTLLPEVSPTLLAPITALRYAPVVEVGVGLRDGSRIPKGFGLLVPSREGENVLGMLFNSTCYPNRAPEGGASLSVFIGGMRRPELTHLPEEEVRQIAVEALKRFFGYAEDVEPEALHVFRHMHAIPQYEADTPERLRAIGNIQLLHPGLYLAGSLSDGIGMADRIEQAYRLAKHFVEQQEV